MVWNPSVALWLTHQKKGQMPCKCECPTWHTTKCFPSWGWRIWIGQHCFTTCMDFSSNLEEIFHHHRIRSIGRKLYSKFKSIGRIHLFRLSHPNQAKSWLMILDFPIYFLCCELSSFCTSWAKLWQTLNLSIKKEFIVDQWIER